MNVTRVLVGNRPRLLRELILNALSEQLDVEIVGEVPDEPQISDAVEKTRPDWLIAGLESTHELPPVCVSLLQKHPELKVIAIAGDGNMLRVYWTEFLIRSRDIPATEAAVLSALRGEVVPALRCQ